MKSVPFAWAAGMLLIAVSSMRGQASGPITPEEIEQGFSNRLVLAKPREGSALMEVATAESTEGRTARRVFGQIGGLRALAVAPGETVEQALDRLRATGRYEYVEPDYIVTKDATPNDPHYLSGDQWSLRNVGQSSGTAGADIHAEEAWDIQSSASNVVVAIIDSGIRPTHEELAPNLWRNSGEPGSRNLFDDDRDGYIDDINGIDATQASNSLLNGTPTDEDGHGTAVASIIAAAGNNGAGMCGVAWSAQLMALKFIDSSGYGLTSDELACLDYAVAKKAQIINCSFGGTAYSQSLFDAYKRTRDAGIIVVCAAGNDAANNDVTNQYPSGFLLDNIVAVANSTRTDSLRSTSDFGSGTVDLAAPGTEIYVASFTGDRSYTSFTGTSFSAPMVSGAMALAKAKYPNESYRETINRVLRSVDVLPAFTGKTATGGRLNIAAALKATSTRPFNDDFAQRSVLAGETITARAAAQLGTREAGEPAHAGQTGNGSLWWTWTAPRSGSLTIDTKGSAFDTTLAVYTGGSLSALTAVASNDDDSGTTTSKVAFNAVSGTTYQIAVDRKAGDAGLVVLHLNLLSANDAFDSAQVVSGLSWSVTSDNRSATRESGEPRIKNNAGGHSVWYRWVAPATRRYHLATFSADFNTMAGVYTGTSVSALNEVTSSLTGGDSNFTMNSASLSFTATAGTTYYIVVDSEVSATGTSSTGTFHVSCIDSDWEFFGFGAPGTPAVATDGTLYFSDDYGYVYGLNADGTSKWRYTMTGYGTYSAPAVGPDGTVYCGDDYYYVHAINPDGSRKWRILTQGVINSIPAVASDGTVYVRSEDGLLYALLPSNGATKWTFRLGTGPAESYSSPTIAPDGTIYVAGGSSKLYALTPDGAQKWSYATDFIYSSPAIAADGTIYFGVYAPGNKLVALKPDGSLKWTVATDDSVSTSPVIGIDGTIYFGCADKNLYAVSASGQVRWKLPVGDAIRNTTPIVACDGSIYTGCDDGKIYAVNADGTLRRTYATAEPLRGSPLLLNGRLLIPSFDYHLYSLDIGLVPATSPWPMHRQNNRRVGRLVTQSLAVGVQPKAQTSADGGSVTFSVGAVGTGTLTYQWRTNSTAIAGATNQSFTLSPVGLTDAGQYSVTITDSSGAITSNAVQLTVTPVAPLFVIQPLTQTAVAGNPLTLTASSSGSVPVTYQWLKDGAPIAGATGTTLKLPLVLVGDAGSYTVSATNVAGTTTSRAAALTVNPANNGRLVNLSILTSLGDDDKFTMGTVVGGASTSGVKPVLIRAVGPTLGAAPFNVGGALTDPKLDVFVGSTNAGSNDDWGGGTALVTANAAVGAFPFSAAASKDAAIAYSANATNAPASFTVQIASHPATSGLVLAEIYDSTPAQQFTTKTPRLVNVSVLKPIGSGLTAGFVVGGITDVKVLIRAIGPTLQAFGVPGAMADPKLDVLDGKSKSVAANDNWGGTTALSTAFGQVGAFALDPASKDAAVVATLSPGSYTVQISAATGESGVALVEIYELP